MKGILLILLTCTGMTFCLSQGISFSGNLLDGETNQPVQYALLYIDGTTFGVTTDENGDFVFNDLSFPIQIEISHLSYEPTTIRFESKIPSHVAIKLKPRSIILESVLILEKASRKKYVRKFVKWFVGNDKWGQKAKLLNDSALVFFDEGKDFRVGASEPLIIECPSLGYTIRAELKEFIVKYNDDLKSETRSFVANYHFTSYEKNKYDRNRTRAYYNSSEHFLKSLYENKTSQNGYQIIKRAILNDGSDQKEIFPASHVNVSLDSCLVWYGENEKKIIGLKGKEYFIQYYYKENGFPLDLKNNKAKLPYNLSAIRFEKNEITLRSDGTTPGTFIVFSGAIGQKKVGAMLPNNYYPKLKNRRKESIPSGSDQSQLPHRLIRKRSN